MPIYARSDVLDLLLEKGYSSYRLREEKLMTPRTMQKIRHGERITMNELETICDLLHVQPSKVIEWERWKKKKKIRAFRLTVSFDFTL